MFADDTTLYLSKNNHFDHVENILKRWCNISGAKFNIGETEIIPIGTPEHWTTIARSRKINQDDQTPLNTQIRIAKDGDATCLLGAWIGSHVDDLTPWECIIDLIKKDIERWGKIKPTMYGKHLIVQAIIGGRTQYLAKVQGMPSKTEKVIQKIIQEFLWDGESAPYIALETLKLPLDEGGLDFSSKHPTWAVITDLLINATAPPNVSPLGRLNTYMQSWDPPTRGPRSSYLNQDILRMISTVKRYKTNLAALWITPDISACLPAWYHMNANHCPMTNIPSKCLLRNHKVKTVVNLVKTSERAQARYSSLHVPNLSCTCINCARDWIKNCRNPPPMCTRSTNPYLQNCT